MKTIFSIFVLSSCIAIADSGVADSHPCAAIAKACETAGFYKGGHKVSKGLFADCRNPILKGQTVVGVSFNPADVPACEAKMQKKNR